MALPFNAPPVHLQLKRKLRHAHMNMQEASSKYARRQQSEFIGDPHPSQFNAVNFITSQTRFGSLRQPVYRYLKVRHPASTCCRSAKSQQVSDPCPAVSFSYEVAAEKPPALSMARRHGGLVLGSFRYDAGIPPALYVTTSASCYNNDGL